MVSPDAVEQEYWHHRPVSRLALEKGTQASVAAGAAGTADPQNSS